MGMIATERRWVAPAVLVLSAGCAALSFISYRAADGLSEIGSSLIARLGYRFAPVAPQPSAGAEEGRPPRPPSGPSGAAG